MVGIAQKRSILGGVFGREMKSYKLCQKLEKLIFIFNKMKSLRFGSSEVSVHVFNG